VLNEDIQWCYRQTNPRPSGLQPSAWTNYAVVCRFPTSSDTISFSRRTIFLKLIISGQSYTWNLIWRLHSMFPCTSIVTMFWSLPLEMVSWDVDREQPNLLPSPAVISARPIANKSGEEGPDSCCWQVTWGDPSTDTNLCHQTSATYVALIFSARFSYELDSFSQQQQLHLPLASPLKEIPTSFHDVLLTYAPHFKNRVSVVGTASGYALDDRGVQLRVLEQSFFCLCRSDRVWGSPRPLSIGYRGGKVAGGSTWELFSN
jgi:hypothetical protein